ncbi:MAG: molybdate ABC transporter substrate-binding protein [Gammaproteobacteria bacterium]|nr:molybdate ABC transporter substrate-binding protein [Gammaproteobacteria bacterium]NNF61882.1 molybdate ABC transporter substrate-binding protein [Gammaproteobacteria bacterium]NNM19650.1 molybdate ABC transporter substrate-binding protein [Gammaproteobacteria bacterium]
MRILTNAVFWAVLLGWAQLSYAELASVAVASNFSETANLLAKEFNQKTGHSIRVSAGSSGKLYAQIINGAPFDVFLSADAERPERIEHEGLAVPGTRISYAEGTLVLWSRNSRYAGKDCLAVLKDLDFRHLAIANPLTAPYGAAARQWLRSLGLWEKLRKKIVTGENIGQAFHFTATRNADLGLIAAAQLVDERIPEGTCSYAVPPAGHAPILQQGLLLQRAETNKAARAFLASLRTDAALEIIRQRGYQLPR